MYCRVRNGGMTDDELVGNWLFNEAVSAAWFL